MLCRKCKREMPSDALFCPYCGVSLRPKKNTRKPRTRPNGAGSAYKDGNTWTAQYTKGYKVVVKDGKPHKQPEYVRKKGFKKRADALDYLPELKKIALSANEKPEKVKLTMQQIYDLWLPTHESKVGKSTMNCYKAAWKYFGPLYGTAFGEIDVDDLQECLDDCSKGKRTKENMKALAGLLMKYAIPRHQTDMNYAKFLHTGNDEKGTRPAFSRDQIKMIDEQIGVTPHAEDVYCLIYTGMRPSELFQLKKSDFRDGVLYGGIKTEAGKDRAVPIAPCILPIIENRFTSDSEYLFPRDDGSAMSAKYFRDNYFYPVLAAAGIQPVPTPDQPPRYVPKSCRHTFANLLKDVPGSDKDKAGLLGHEDYNTTKKHYQSVELDALKAIINQL